MDKLNLERQIVAAVKEEQMKLGYEKETVRLYYPLESMQLVLKTGNISMHEMLDLLHEWAENIESFQGTVEIGGRKNRLCLAVGPEAVEYIHTHYPDDPFLEELIDAVRKPGCTLEQVLDIFKSYHGEITCEQADLPDFNYVIYTDQEDWRYCFHIDEHHAIYHRFTKDDYQQMFG